MSIRKKILIVMLSISIFLCGFPIGVVANVANTNDVSESVITTNVFNNQKYYDVDNTREETNKKTIRIGDCITLGTYLGESIVWRCVDIDENGPLMLSEKILCFKSFDAKGMHGNYLRNKEGTNNWKESCLRRWLNSSGIVDWGMRPAIPSAVNVFNGYNPYSDEEGFLSSFDSTELSLIKPVVLKTYINSLDENYADGGSGEYNANNGSFSSSLVNAETMGYGKMYQNTTDSIFLLDYEQAGRIYINLGGEALVAYPTSSAVVDDDSQQTSSDKAYKYWMRTPGTYGMSYEIVQVIDSYQSIQGVSSFSVLDAINYQNVGVRPAFYLNLDKYGDYSNTTQEVVINDKVFNTNIDYYIANWDSSNYNPELSNMLGVLSAAVYDKQKIEAAYESLGFSFDDSKKYGCYDYESTDPFKCGCAISFKKSEYNEDIICLVTIRGTSTKYNLVGDACIETTFDGKHAGFAYAANYIYLHLKDLMSNHFELQDVKYVITGHSLGAAVGNLLSVELMQKGVSADNIYNYNYACPDVACLKNFPTPYGNIFNICNTEDFVTYLPGEPCNVFTMFDDAWWDKYGQTYWFTYEDEKFGFASNHDINLYVEFLEQRLDNSEFPYSISSNLALWFVKVMCPVNVIITDKNGNQVASVIDGEVTYYDSSFDGRIFVFTDGDKKVFYIDSDTDFNIDLIGTDDGMMNFTLGKYNLATNDVSESKTFNDVILKSGKTMKCTVNETIEINDVSLFVVEKKDGELKCTHTIETDGTETNIYPSVNEGYSNESEQHFTLSDSNESSIFNNQANFTKETIIFVGAVVTSVILLIISCVIVRKQK